MADKSIQDRITNIMTWLREPDWTEEASMEWLMDWMNRRPIAELAMVAMLMPAEPSPQDTTEPSNG
jgi:hypothetical protein